MFDVGGSRYAVGVTTRHDRAQRLTCSALRDNPIPVHELVDVRRMLKVATLEDTLELTDRRFRRMSSLGRGVPTPKELGVAPARARLAGAGPDRGAAALPPPLPPLPPAEVRRHLHGPARPGGRPLVFFTRPEHAKEIFAGDPEHFHAGKANAILGPIMGEHSLLLQDSIEHKRARKLLMPAFNGHALRDYHRWSASSLPRRCRAGSRARSSAPSTG